MGYDDLHCALHYDPVAVYTVLPTPCYLHSTTANDTAVQIICTTSAQHLHNSRTTRAQLAPRCRAPQDAPRCAHRSVRSLGAAEAELEQGLVLPRGQAEARGVGGDEGRVVREVEEGGLEELADAEGPLEADEGRAREDDAPLRDGVEADGGGVEVLEPGEEARLGVGEGPHLAEVLDVGGGEPVVLDVLQALLEAGEDGELALERVLAEEEVEDARLFVEVRLPVRVAWKRVGGVRGVWEGCG